MIPVPTIPEPIDDETNGESEGEEPIPSTRVHVVKQGEVLGFIANKYGVTIEAIMAINPEITNRNFIFVGQVILIP